jgi:hypothetical protein
VLGVSSCDEDDLYAAMDWVLARKDAIENSVAARHLSNGTLVLYDVSSAAFEGRTCGLRPAASRPFLELLNQSPSYFPDRTRFGPQSGKRGAATHKS